MIALLYTLFATPAVAGDQKLNYDLSIDGKSVGHRDVTITWLPGAAGEVRLIQSYTEIDATVLGAHYAMKNRAGGKVGGGAPSFNSSVDDNGTIREIQGRLLPDRRWSVSISEKGKNETYNLRPTEMGLTSLDLLDAERSRNLWGASTARVLMVETGGVLSGPVEDLGESTVKIAGEEIVVHRYAWTPETGRSEFAWTADGVLVGYQSTVLGKTLAGTLRALPLPPTMGEIGTPTTTSVGFQEESL